MDYAVVAFLDVLGFAEMVQADSVATKPTRLLTFLEIFEKIRKDHGGAVRMFSDSIVIESDLTLAGVQAVVSLARKLQREFLKHGILVRGGVAFGKHFSDSNTIYSEALVNAYYIESRKARNPRIVVDANLVDFFENHPDITAADREWLKMSLCRDRDGCAFIDYIAVDNLEEVYPQVLNLTVSTSNTTDSVVEKLCWLLDYHSFTCTRASRSDLLIEALELEFSTY